MELGFAYYDPITKKVCIPEKQLINILNFDETCMSMDGSTQNRGVRPEVILYDPRFPQVGKVTSKSSLTSTMITGSNAAGDPIPPHLQFQSTAMSKEMMKLQYDVIDHIMPRVRGQFGCAEVRLWPVTFGANEKGRMDSEKFHELNCSVVPSCEEPAWQVCHVEGGQWPREDEPHSSRQAKTLGIHLLPLRPKYNIQHKR